MNDKYKNWPRPRAVEQKLANADLVVFGDEWSLIHGSAKIFSLQYEDKMKRWEEVCWQIFELMSKPRFLTEMPVPPSSMEDVDLLDVYVQNMRAFAWYKSDPMHQTKCELYEQGASGDALARQRYVEIYAYGGSVRDRPNKFFLFKKFEV